MVLKARAVSLTTPIVMSRGHLTMPTGKEHCTRDELSHTFDIGMFKTIEKNLPQ